jgi:hypothetical protein
VRDDVKARSPLLVVLGLRNTPSARRPLRRNVFGQRDGSVARIYELAPLLVRRCPAKPRLGGLQDVEGSVPHPRYTGDLISLPFAVASGFVPFPGARVLLLLDPTVFYVAGYVSVLSRGCKRHATMFGTSGAGAAALPRSCA